MSISLQCSKYAKHMIYKGGKNPSYASRKERKVPLSCVILKPNDDGELVPVYRIKINSNGTY